MFWIQLFKHHAIKDGEGGGAGGTYEQRGGGGGGGGGDKALNEAKFEHLILEQSPPQWPEINI